MNIRQINGFLIHLPIGIKIIVVVSFDPVDSPYFGKPLSVYFINSTYALKLDGSWHSWM